MNKNACRIQSLVLIGFLLVFLILNIAIPDRSFSEQENRYLQTLPRFRISEFFSGRFSSNFEDYVTDQFAFRDQWMSLKARAELLIGKGENNGICYCSDETLIEPFIAPTEEEFARRLEAIEALKSVTDIPVYFALIPTAAEIWSDMLPDGVPNDSQKALIDFADRELGGSTVDIYGALSAKKDEPIFYRTDHHWTTLGAYYGYCAVAETMNMQPIALDTYTKQIVSDSFLGTNCASSGFSWVHPDSIWTYVSQEDAVVTNFPEGEPVTSMLYDESALLTRDKYRYFYGGNTPLLTVETGNEGAPSLLILRDSYMDSMSPFLFAHFSKLHILDLRYFRADLSAYLTENDIDCILVCYSVKNFCEDASIFLAVP